MELEVYSTTTSRAENAFWTPVQFSVKTMLLLTVPWAGLLAVAITGGIRVAFGVVILGLLWFFLARCVELVFVGGGPDGGSNIKQTDA